MQQMQIVRHFPVSQIAGDSIVLLDISDWAGLPACKPLDPPVSQLSGFGWNIGPWSYATDQGTPLILTKLQSCHLQLFSLYISQV